MKSGLSKATVNYLAGYTYIAKSEMETWMLFSHENQGAPPSVSHMEDLRQCIMSDLVKCFEKVATAEDWDAPEVHAKILVGPSLLICCFLSHAQHLETMQNKCSYLMY